MLKDSFFAFIEKERRSVSQQIFKVVSRYKDYRRFPQIKLPKPESLRQYDFESLLLKRKSQSKYSNKPLTKQTISTLLYWSCGIRKNDGEKQHRFQPSGGALYPLEVYVSVSRAENIDSGVYHYNIIEHSLEKLITANYIQVVKNFDHESSHAQDAGMIILLSFIKSRSMEKYGALAYKIGLLEGGHIGQNIYLIGTALNVGVCALGLGMSSILDKALNIDGTDESLIYGLAVGERG